MADAGKRRRGGLTTFLFVLLGVVLLFVFLPIGPGLRTYRQPSGSMQPALFAGDYLVVTKWTFGYGRYSFAPFPSPINEGRLFGRAPRRGELVVFRPYPEPDRDFVKRVIGLPGDRILMIDGLLHINGEPVAREALGELAYNDGSGEVVRAAGYRETLPGGASYVVLERTDSSELDNTRVYLVPAGHYFVMGDDRDNSADSRVPSVVGFVPLENFIGPVSGIIPASGAGRLEQAAP